MHIVKIQNLSTPLPHPITAPYCDTFWSRFRGLMLRPAMPTGSGLVIANASDSRMDSAIHMFFMNFDIAAVWVNSKNSVVDVQLARRWHPFYIPQAAGRYVLELNPDQQAHFKIGDLVEMKHA